jgi:DNA-directed RNA polymerase subunit RPC12/RpoP
MEPVTIECPYCGAQVILEGNRWRYSCGRCGGRLDSRAQLAFVRGQNLLEFGKESMISARDAGSHAATHTLELEAVEYYQRAYSEVRYALQFELSDDQRGECIQMMTDLTRFFARRMMTTGLEANYWARVMIEYNAQKEQDEIEERLAHWQHAGLTGMLRRWRWQRRRRQLRRSLKRLAAQITQYEELIGFVDPIRARKLPPAS